MEYRAGGSNNRLVRELNPRKQKHEHAFYEGVFAVTERKREKAD